MCTRYRQLLSCISKSTLKTAWRHCCWYWSVFLPPWMLYMKFIQFEHVRIYTTNIEIIRHYKSVVPKMYSVNRNFILYFLIGLKIFSKTIHYFWYVSLSYCTKYLKIADVFLTTLDLIYINPRETDLCTFCVLTLYILSLINKIYF